MFTVNETAFGWEEIAAAAQVWGEWDELMNQARRGLAGFKLAAETGEWPAANEVQAAATQFRYKYNLISGQETQAWISHWGLTVDEWMNYFRREMLRERWGNRLEKLPTGADEIAAIIKCEALCSGKFAEWANKLAGRTALVFGAAESGSLVLPGESPREMIERIEAAFEQLREETVTPKRLQAQIADHCLDWIHYDCRYLWFPEERIAREAAYCVIEDGMTLDEVADDARGIVQHWDFYLDEIESSARPHFLAARAGHWLGPIKMMEGFPLFDIVNKQMPAASDPRILQRAEQAVINSLMEKEMNERVRWMM